jgi:hypothetical protein
LFVRAFDLYRFLSMLWAGRRLDRFFTKSISIKSNLAQEKVCECFNVDFFQAIKLIYGYALRRHSWIALLSILARIRSQCWNGTEVSSRISLFCNDEHSNFVILYDGRPVHLQRRATMKKLCFEALVSKFWANIEPLTLNREDWHFQTSLALITIERKNFRTVISQ